MKMISQAISHFNGLHFMQALKPKMPPQTIAGNGRSDHVYKLASFFLLSINPKGYRLNPKGYWTQDVS